MLSVSLRSLAPTYPPRRSTGSARVTSKLACRQLRSPHSRSRGLDLSRPSTCRSRVVVRAGDLGGGGAPQSGEELQAALDDAVRREDYTQAALLRDALKSTNQSIVAEVSRANAKFYDAFDEMSIAGMRAVWGEGAHVQCIHPGSACIAGHDAVLESWDSIFSAQAGGMRQRMDIRCASVRVHASDALAFVTCLEYVGAMDEANLGGGLAATNVFEKQGGEWKIVHHQAAPAMG